MKRRMLWTLLAFVLAAPALWAGSTAAGCCPIGCDDCSECPLGR